MKTPETDPFQSLRNLEVQPSGQVWKQVEQSLPAPRRTVSPWWWAAALVPLGALVWQPTPVQPAGEATVVNATPPVVTEVPAIPAEEVKPVASIQVAPRMEPAQPVSEVQEDLQLAWTSAEPVDLEAEEAPVIGGEAAPKPDVSFKVAMRPKVQEPDPETGLAHQTVVAASRQLGGWVSMAEEEALKLGRDLTGLIRGNPDTQSNQSP
jgi:hypothetical protein